MPPELERFSINTATLGYQLSLDETIEAVAARGFGGIAPWRRELEGEDVAAVARHLRDAGLRVSGYCRSTYLPARTRDGWRRNVEDNKRAMRDAAALDADCFMLVVGGMPDGSKDLADARNQVSDGVAELLREARQAGIRLAVEPLHPMYAADRACVNTVEQALNLCAALDPGRSGFLGIALDVYHTWWDPDLAAGIARMAEEGRLLAFHINDWLVPTTDLLNDRGMPGEGVIDLDGIIRQVAKTGYNGSIELEVFSTRLWQMPPDALLTAAATACSRLICALKGDAP